MGNKPLVSVIIPTYKRPKKLERALKSVLNQTYNNLEIIVVNDYPYTNVDYITDLDDRISLINHEENKGAPAARNTGIKNSMGKYIALLDDDDSWHTQKIKRQIKKFMELDSSCGLIYTWAKFIESNNKIRKSKPNCEGNVFENLLKSNFIPSASPLIKKVCFDDVGLFDEELKSNQDYDLWLRIANHYKFSYVPEYLVEIHQDHPDRISTNLERRKKGKERFIKKHKSDFERFPEILHDRYKLLGVESAYYGDKKTKCSNYFKKSLKYKKTDISSIIYYLISRLPKKIRQPFFKYVLKYYGSLE